MMGHLDISRVLLKDQRRKAGSLTLKQGSKVAVIGGGPAGAFFSYFLLDMAERNDLDIILDIYEPRDFKKTAPTGCNMCGGVLYESLIQSLAVEGINLPTTVVQRGIEYNMLHMDIGSAQIKTPQQEKRIATTFRGSGPRDLLQIEDYGLDNYLFEAALDKGARHFQGRVTDVKWGERKTGNDPVDSPLLVKSQDSDYQPYDFLAVTPGVNTAILKRFEELDPDYTAPKTTRLLVREYKFGEDAVTQYLGPVFHGFLLDIPGLDYGAIIPKGDYVTVCLLSSKGDLEPETMDIFLEDPAVRSILPPDFSAQRYSCSCRPNINVKGIARPYHDRIIYIGDSGVSRLYKDGIGAAYRTAKVAASTAVFQGISRKDFQDHYYPLCKKISRDNRIGKLIFRLISQIQKFPFARRAVLQMVVDEQIGKADPGKGMSSLMWDMLTGGAPYREVLGRAFQPAFWSRLLQNLAKALISNGGMVEQGNSLEDPQTEIDLNPDGGEELPMNIGALGKVYKNGEIVVRQGEPGDCMYVIQEGVVEVIFESEGDDVELNVLGKDDFFGEMALFNQEVRTATVRARGQARILTVNHKNLLKCIHEDPSLAYRLMQVMSDRIDRLSEAVADLSNPPGD